MLHASYEPERVPERHLFLGAVSDDGVTKPCSFTDWVAPGFEFLFLACSCLLICAVSVHDAALVVVNHQVIGEVEQNPVGLWLLQLLDGEVWLFVVTKLACTALVCALLSTIYQYRKSLAIYASGGLVAFQLSLLCYLMNY